MGVPVDIFKKTQKHSVPARGGTGMPNRKRALDCVKPKPCPSLASFRRGWRMARVGGRHEEKHFKASAALRAMADSRARGRKVTVRNKSPEDAFRMARISGFRFHPSSFPRRAVRRTWRKARSVGLTSGVSLRRGTGFVGLDGCKDCDTPGTERGNLRFRATGFPVPFCSRGLRGRFF